MVASRATPTVTDIIGWARRQLRDPATEADGSTRPETSRAYTDATITEAIDEAIIELQMHMAAAGDSTFVRETTMEMTDGVAAVPFSVDGCPIESIRAQVGTEWVTVMRGTYTAPDDTGANEYPVFYRWHLVAQGGSAATGLPSPNVVITPSYTGTIQVRYWDPAVLPDAVSDQHSLLRLWGEMVALIAARNLLAIDEDVTDQQERRLHEKLNLFHQITKQRGKRVRRRPR